MADFAAEGAASEEDPPDTSAIDHSDRSSIGSKDSAAVDANTDADADADADDAPPALHDSHRLVAAPDSGASAAALRVVRRIFLLTPRELRDKRFQQSPAHDALFDGLVDGDAKRTLGALEAMHRRLAASSEKMAATMEKMRGNERMDAQAKATRLRVLALDRDALEQRRDRAAAAAAELRRRCPTIYCAGEYAAAAGAAMERMLRGPLAAWTAARFGAGARAHFNAVLRRRGAKAWGMEIDAVVADAQGALTAVVEVKLAPADAQKSVDKRLRVAAEAAGGGGAEADLYFIGEDGGKLPLRVSAAGLGEIFAVVEREDRHEGLDSAVFHQLKGRALAVALLHEDEPAELAAAKAAELLARVEAAVAERGQPPRAKDDTLEVRGAHVIFIDDLLAAYAP